MEAFIPYLVIAGVVIVFFGLCYALFNKPDKKQKHEPVAPKQTEHHSIKDYGSTYYSNVNRDDASESKQTFRVIENGVDVTAKHAAVQENAQDKSSNAVVAENTANFKIEHTQAIPKVAEQIEHTAVIPAVRNIEETQFVGNVNDIAKVDELKSTPSSDMEATQLIGAVTGAAAASAGVVGAVSMASAAGAGSVSAQAAAVPGAVGAVANSADNNNLSVLEETRLINVDEINKALAEDDGKPKQTVSPWMQEAQEQEMVDLAIKPFIQSFGLVGESTKANVESITREALAALQITKISEVRYLLENIVVQEAIMCMQKAYAANPTDSMRAVALEAFFDVVQQPKSSTPYLVAFDALRVLPHMTLGHFQIMALSLLLQYSRNSNNYTLSNFQHYVEKYIEPFISDVPHDSSFFRQLDYLRCTIQERESITLAQLLGNSYPFVFNFRGFSREELEYITGRDGIDPNYIVKSMNSSLYKLAMVDDSMAPRFFRQAHITDASMQRDLLALMRSKPTSFSGAEARNIMDDISPVLLDLADLFDNGPMSAMSLTLLGLYLGRAHVKATIGEEFDLSRWF